MQAEITFPENTIGTKATDHLKVFTATNPIQKLRQFVEKSDWDERLLECDKYMGRFSWGIIIASVIFFIPVCINIFIR